MALTLDEVVAPGVFLLRARREGKSVWQVFWLGGTLSETAADLQLARPDEITASATVPGTGLPWNLVASFAIGIWLPASPAVLAITGAGADSTYIFGAVVGTVAVVAFAGVRRAVRLLNIAFGAWLPQCRGS